MIASPSPSDATCATEETVAASKSQARLLRFVSELPAVIAAPSTSPDRDDDPVYRPLFGPKSATVGELRIAVDALWQSIALEQRKAIALTQMLLLVSAGRATDDTRVSAALQRIAGAVA